MAQDETPEDQILASVRAAGPLPPPDEIDSEIVNTVRDAESTDDVNDQLATYAYNDYGNARRLIRRYGDELLYVRDVGWHAYTGTHWSREEGKDLAIRLAHKTATAMIDEAKAIVSAGPFDDEKPAEFDERCDKAFKWATGSGNQNRILAMLGQAQPYMPASTEDMDANRFSFNVQNGTLSLGETVALRGHDRTDRITRMARVAFDPTAECPEFRKFLDQILPDVDVQGQGLARYVSARTVMAIGIAGGLIKLGVEASRAYRAACTFAHSGGPDALTGNVRLPGELWPGSCLTVLAIPAYEGGRTPILRIDAKDPFIGIFNGSLFGDELEGATFLLLNNLVHRIRERLGLEKTVSADGPSARLMAKVRRELDGD